MIQWNLFFSHSALGVGWDNPNVFTICTLNESISQIKKRQEIGRGLRLCLKQDGRRYRDPEGTIEGQEVNRLTIVPNENYRAFVLNYQSELRDEFGEVATPPKIQDDRRSPVRIKSIDNRMKSKHLMQLWHQIAGETECRVFLHEETLIKRGIEKLSEIIIDETELKISLHRWASMSNEVIEDINVGTSSRRLKIQYPSIDIVGQLSKSCMLSKKTLRDILLGLPDAQLAMLAMNPMKFILEATHRLHMIVNEELVRLVSYRKTGRTLSLSEILNIEDETISDITPTPNRGLYDHIIHESSYEKDMAIAFDNLTTVRLFFKLPKAYKIPTPIGNYTPDFAIIMEKRDLNDLNGETRYYFVIEVKGTSEIDKLRPEERLKIEFAIKHFEALGVRGYLAPVNNSDTFDKKSIKAVGETFFDQ